MSDDVNEVQYVMDNETGAIAQLTYPVGMYDRVDVENELTAALQRLENE